MFGFRKYCFVIIWVGVGIVFGKYGNWVVELGCNYLIVRFKKVDGV